MKFRLLCAAAITLAVPAAAQQASPTAPSATPTAVPATPTPEQVAAMFGAREQVQQISLSPDGHSLAILRPTDGHGSQLLVARMDVEQPNFSPVLRASGSPDRLLGCHWIANDRLICRLYIIANAEGMRLGFTRLIAVDADGRNLRLLNQHNGVEQLGISQNGGDLIDYEGGTPGSVLITHEFVPENTTGTHMAQNQVGLGVDRLDTRTLARSVVEPPRLEASAYISDGHGNIRIMAVAQLTSTGDDSGRTHWMYRRRDSRDWRPLNDTALSATGTVSGFQPLAVDPDADVVYGLDEANGHAALFKVSLDGSMRREMVFSRPTVDIDDVLQVGRQQRVVGATYVEDQRQTDFFDPALQRLRTALGRAVPGLPLITFVDASEDGNTLLLLARSDTEPGRYYLLDRTTRHMAELMPARPELAALHLASVRSITYPAADGTPIPAYLTLPPGSDGRGLPAIVLPHGGPAARDEWGFDWLAQFLAQRGYAVLQPNYRGSTGYGDAYFRRNGFQSWQTAIGDVDAGGRWLVSQGIARADRLAIVGWSYGGYAALQSQVVDPNLFKAVVAIAPVTDLDAARAEARNFTSARLVSAQLGDAATAAAASPARHADRFQAPVLLFHGNQDQNVGIGESRLMAARLHAAGKNVDLVEFPGLDHQLNDNQVRTRMLARIDQFLRTSMHIEP